MIQLPDDKSPTQLTMIFDDSATTATGGFQGIYGTKITILANGGEP